MKFLRRVTVAVCCFVAAAALLRCGGGSPQPILPLTITPASLPNGTAGTSYSQNVEASGGAAPFHWAVSAGTLPHNLQLIPTGMNSATISGTPDTVAQGVTFSVNVTDSANQAATQSYTVSILAQPDTLTLSPASLNFGPQLAGTASGTQTGTLTNTGSSPVAINNVASTGTNAGDFSESNTCGSSLAPGSDCAIHVTFTPARSGPRAASIAITDDTVGSPHQLPLSGTGLTSGPNATLSATSLIFPNQNVGTTSTALTITLTNYGEAPLNVSGIAATANFAESDSCVGSLVRATSCPINVTFIPSSAGSITSTLSVTDNAADSPQTVPLSGTGVAACLPQGAMCYGLAHPQCCAVPRPHHAVCSNPNGWGTCVED